jgi:hypothetical protein
MTSGSSLAVVRPHLDRQEVIHPCGPQRGSQVESEYFESLETKTFKKGWWRWSKRKVRIYSTGLALFIVDVALCLTVLAGVFTNSTWLRTIVRVGVAVALVTLFVRLRSKIQGKDATSQPGASDPIGQIEKLADLKAKGILKEEEFENKKAELLARM